MTTLVETLAEINAKIDAVTVKVDALVAPVVNVDLTPVLDSVSAVSAKIG